MTKVADFICPPWCFAQNSQFAQSWIKLKNISLENWKMQFVQRFIGRRKKERWRVRCLVSDTKVVKQNRVNEHRGRLNAIALFALVFPLSTTTSSSFSSFNWSSPIEDWSLIRELHHHHHYHYHQHDHQCSIWSISVNTRLHWQCPDKLAPAQWPNLTDRCAFLKASLAVSTMLMLMLMPLCVCVCIVRRLNVVWCERQQLLARFDWERVQTRTVRQIDPCWVIENDTICWPHCSSLFTIHSTQQLTELWTFSASSKLASTFVSLVSATIANSCCCCCCCCCCQKNKKCSASALRPALH